MHIRLTSGCVHGNLVTSPLYVSRFWIDREALFDVFVPHDVDPDDGKSHLES